jgi:hypothetical protein
MFLRESIAANSLEGKFLFRLGQYILLGSVPVTAQPVEVTVPKIAPEQFENILKLIKPQPGELRFHEVPWLIDVWEARREAAKEGKPILVWSGAGGAPIGVC